MSNTPVAEDELVAQENALRVYLASLLTESAPAQAEVEKAAPIVSQPVELRKREPQINATQADKHTLMTFKVAGVRLAVPIKSFSGVQTLVDEIDTREQNAWYLGSLNNGEQEMHIIDTYRLIIPQDRQSTERLSSDNYGKTVLLLNYGRIGLLCDETTKVTTLDADAITWRKDSSSRNWLAGTAAHYAMAILNVYALEKMLKNYLTGTKTAEL